MRAGQEQDADKNSGSGKRQRQEIGEGGQCDTNDGLLGAMTPSMPSMGLIGCGREVAVKSWLACCASDRPLLSRVDFLKRRFIKAIDSHISNQYYRDASAA